LYHVPVIFFIQLGILLEKNNLSPGPVISGDKLFLDTGV